MVAENKRQGQVILFPHSRVQRLFLFPREGRNEAEIWKQENSTGSVIHVISIAHQWTNHAR